MDLGPGPRMRRNVDTGELSHIHPPTLRQHAARATLSRFSSSPLSHSQQHLQHAPVSHRRPPCIIPHAAVSVCSSHTALSCRLIDTPRQAAAPLQKRRAAGVLDSSAARLKPSCLSSLPSLPSRHLSSSFRLVCAAVGMVWEGGGGSGQKQLWRCAS
jgi:hypothetical protein